MIPLPAEVREFLQRSIRLTSYILIQLIDLLYKRLILHAIRRFAVHLNRLLVGLLGIVIEKTDVAYLRSFPCVVVKKTFQVTCGDPETEVDLILSRAGIFETPKDIDDFTICPSHRSNLGTGVGWIRGFISRYRFKIPIGELASVYHRQYARCLENSYNLAIYHLVQNYASRQTQVSIGNWSVGYQKSRQRRSFLY